MRRDRRGEYFDLQMPGGAIVDVLNADKSRRHLLLLVNVNGEKSRFLCGHDERHWFVAAIPETETGVVNVARARQALMPAIVRSAMRGLHRSERARRRNRAFVRQGEWFFVPVADFVPEYWTVLHHEPLRRGRGKSHVMEFAYRRGGTIVYVNSENPNGLTQPEFDAIPVQLRNRQRWRQMIRDADVFAMGRVTRPDHATIELRGWHRVFVNTESGARAMRHIAFLD